MSFESLAERITKELRASQHADSEELVLFVLSFAAMLRPGPVKAVQAINAILSTVCVSDVNLYFALCAELPNRSAEDGRARAQNPRIRFGRFTSGKTSWGSSIA